MFNPLEYSHNYSMTSKRSWNYFRDKVSDDANENNAGNNRINSNKTITSKSFEYSTKITGKTWDDKNTLE